MIEEIKSKIGQSVIVRDVSELRIRPTPIMAVDIETFGENKLPGDSPCYTNHGICGISVGNLFGDAAYMVVNDGRNYGGIPIDAAIAALNNLLASGVKVVLIHYSKFDLGFLLKRGLKIAHLRIVDTWMLRNIKSQGNYVANKLKEIIRKKFGIATDTEKEKDEWMEKNGTEDYGDVPVEIMAKYACDDPRYSLLSYLTEAEMSQEDWTCHDLYMRNHLHLIDAERHGAALQLDLVRQRLMLTNKAIEDFTEKFKTHLGAAAVDMNDDQAIMRFLHEKNLHAKPREQYGETRFVFDEEFLLACDHPLAQCYFELYRRKMFRHCFSGSQGEMQSNIFMDSTGQAGFHLSHLCSIFSKGGIPQVKKPDITERVRLTNEVRELFIPRPGKHFVHLRAHDLPSLLIGFYCNDLELMAAVRTGTPSAVLRLLSTRQAKPKENVISLLLRQTFEGSGAERLLHRLRIAEEKGFGDKKSVYPVQDGFSKIVRGLDDMKNRLKESLASSGSVRDRLGRVLRIEPDSQYRSQAVLLQSSYGSLLAFYLDVFARLAKETGAQLILAHEKEFLFEVEAGDGRFVAAAREMSQQRLIDPMPVWIIQAGLTKWESDRLDSHEVALGRL